MTARDVARRVLRRVGEGAYATLALSGELDRARGLSPADKRLATELVYGTLRNRARLDHALEALSTAGLGSLDAATLDAMRIGAHQILFMRIPAHAAVDDAVAAVKRARGPRLAGLVNAILRRLAREGEPPIPAAPIEEHLRLSTSSPPWLVAAALTRFPQEEARAFLEALARPAPMWVRANTLTTSRDALSEALYAERGALDLRPAIEVPEALRVMGEGLLSTRAFAEGRFVVQDLGAQLVAHLVEPQPGDKILDACAGVGGKATHLAALSGDRAHIDAADRSERKLELCADTAHRLGVRSLTPVACDLRAEDAPLAAEYDRVLLDAPCSGLGVLRRHPEARWRPRPDLSALAETQAQLLHCLARRVRPGGRLVYAVCTFTDEEGGGQIERFLAQHPEFAAEPPPAALAKSPLFDQERHPGPEGALRTWPHLHDADAFYAIRLRRMR
jgi:16S rRNA (cytosine967-C5)-methyltransferase